LNGAAVRVNQEYAPVVFASWNKVTFVCPAAEPGRTLSVVVETEAGASEPLTRSNAAIAPGLLFWSTTAPVKVLRISRARQCWRRAGISGDWANRHSRGTRSRFGPLDWEKDRCRSFTVGGLGARLESVERMPGVAGVFEITVTVPPGVAEGGQVPVVVTLPLSEGESAGSSDRARSNAVTIAIEAAKD
jgi:uncharacterized protein (TIGR03437 family)